LIKRDITNDIIILYFLFTDKLLVSIINYSRSVV